MLKNIPEAPGYTFVVENVNFQQPVSDVLIKDVFSEMNFLVKGGFFSSLEMRIYGLGERYYSVSPKGQDDWSGWKKCDVRDPEVVDLDKYEIRYMEPFSIWIYRGYELLFSVYKDDSRRPFTKDGDSSCVEFVGYGIRSWRKRKIRKRQELLDGIVNLFIEKMKEKTGA